MQKISLFILGLFSISALSSCVTPSQRDAMQRDINYLDKELDTLRKNMTVQTKLTERNTNTTLASQSDLDSLHTQLAENSGEIDTLKMKFDHIEKNGSRNLEQYREAMYGLEKSIEKLQRKVAFLETQLPFGEKTVQPSKKIKDSFNPKNVNDVNNILKYDYEKGWFKNVIMKSSMVIQSSKSKSDMVASALEFRGEANYKLSRYSDAVADFTEYIQKYPSGSKRARVLLLLGDSYVFLRQNTVAKSYYSECLEEFKETSEGKACSERVKKL